MTDSTTTTGWGEKLASERGVCDYYLFFFLVLVFEGVGGVGGEGEERAKKMGVSARFFFAA